MDIIRSIEEFEQVYDITSSINFFIKPCSIEVLEYYMKTYIVSKFDYNYISLFQPLTMDFIGIYKDKLNFSLLLINDRTPLTYEFMLQYLYYFNLYESYSIVEKRNFEPNVDILDRLVKEFPEKYKIDKLVNDLNR